MNPSYLVAKTTKTSMHLHTDQPKQEFYQITKNS